MGLKTYFPSQILLQMIDKAYKNEFSGWGFSGRCHQGAEHQLHAMSLRPTKFSEKNTTVGTMHSAVSGLCFISCSLSKLGNKKLTYQWISQNTSELPTNLAPDDGKQGIYFFVLMDYIIRYTYISQERLSERDKDPPKNSDLPNNKDQPNMHRTRAVSVRGSTEHTLGGGVLNLTPPTPGDQF